jgi:hypothetical protein
MSQPPKFTNFAPRRRCNAFSGVFRRIAFAGEITESIPFARANLDGSTRPGCRQNKAFPAVRQWARVSKEGNLSGLRLRRRAGTRLAKFALALRQWLFVPLLLVAQPSGRVCSEALMAAHPQIVCTQCDKPEDSCTCEKYCTICKGQHNVRLCADGLYYCPDCREACDVALANER